MSDKSFRIGNTYDIRCIFGVDLKGSVLFVICNITQLSEVPFRFEAFDLHNMQLRDFVRAVGGVFYREEYAFVASRARVEGKVQHL